MIYVFRFDCAIDVKLKRRIADHAAQRRKVHSLRRLRSPEKGNAKTDAARVRGRNDEPRGVA
jgi:hypothetical protein